MWKTVSLGLVMVVALMLTACSAGHPVPSAPGRTDDQGLSFALTKPWNPDAQYAETLVGRVSDSNGCLTVTTSGASAQTYVPIFPVHVAAASTLRVGDIVVLRGAEQGGRGSSWEPREKTIERLGVAMPAECPVDAALYLVTTQEDDPLVSGTTNSDPALGYAWQDPFTFDRHVVGDTDTLPGTATNRDGCLIIEAAPDGMGEVLPVFAVRSSPLTFTMAAGDAVNEYGWLGAIAEDKVVLVTINPHHGEITYTTTDIVLGYTEGLRVPEGCPETAYLWISG